MDALKLGFILLLPLSACSEDLGGETVVKTIGKQPDVTQICTNETETITLIVCMIRTQRSGGGNCSLLYQDGHDFEQKCDPRFTLMKENQTVFLHLINLTSEDSGTYTCQCSHIEGTRVLHLNVTVEDVRGSTVISVSNYRYVVGAVFVVITGVILGVTYKMKSRSSCSMSEAAGLSVHETHGSLEEDVQDEPYTSLQHPTNDLYQTITSVQHNTTTL